MSSRRSRCTVECSFEAQEQAEEDQSDGAAASLCDQTRARQRVRDGALRRARSKQADASPAEVRTRVPLLQDGRAQLEFAAVQAHLLLQRRRDKRKHESTP